MSSSQIIFYEKSKCDNSLPGISATASEGSDYAAYVLNRSNLSAWVTTGSVDANNTTLTVDMVDAQDVSEIFLVKHNFKAYTVKYWDGAAYQAFSPAISETNNTTETKHYSVTEVSTSKLQITITGTMTANDDKHLYQFIATNEIGQLAGWPVIDNPVHSTNNKLNTMLSGKKHLTKNVGGFGCELTVKEWRSNADLTIVETLYDSVEGFLVWLSGGNTSQFSSSRKGYRLEDIYLMRCVDEYKPEFVAGQYFRGLNIKMKLAEVVT